MQLEDLMKNDYIAYIYDSGIVRKDVYRFQLPSYLYRDRRVSYLYRDRRIFGILDGICYKENIKNNHRCRRIIGRYHVLFAIQWTSCPKLGEGRSRIRKCHD